MTPPPTHRRVFPFSTPLPTVNFLQFQSPQILLTPLKVKMAACGGFGNIDFLVKATGLADAGLRLTIGLFLGNLCLIVISGVDCYTFC